MVTADDLARVRHAGLVVALDAGSPGGVLQGPARLAALARDLAADREAVRSLLECERRAWDELGASLDRADRIEAAARARGEVVPDPDDPTVDCRDWYERQPDPPQPDSGPWPKQTVVVDVDDDGRIVSGPLCDAEGREVAP